MPSLLLVIFVLQLLVHLVNTVGASTIENLLWHLYSLLPTPTSRQLQEQQTLRTEVVRLKRELNATSSQDEFAKWAKLRRQHDKAVAAYEEKTTNLTTHRTLFTRTITTLRFLGLNGLRFLLQFWFAKIPLFWIPRGWVPWYVEFLLSFPRAPRGSVSVQVWWAACAGVILLGGEVVGGVWGLLVGGWGREEEKRGMGMEGREGKKGEKEL